MRDAGTIGETPHLGGVELGELGEVLPCGAEMRPVETVGGDDLPDVGTAGIASGLAELEGAMLDRLATSLKLSPEERTLAQSDGMLATAIMGQTTSGDVVAVAREIEARASAGFEETMRFQVPPTK